MEYIFRKISVRYRIHSVRIALIAVNSSQNRQMTLLITNNMAKEIRQLGTLNCICAKLGQLRRNIKRTSKYGAIEKR